MWFSTTSTSGAAAAAAAVSEQDLKTLPPFFPANTRKCAQVSQEFFDCFSLNAVKVDDSDVEAGKKGLLACKKQLHAYKVCMESCFEQKKELQQKRFRVQEEYRNKA